MYATTLSSICFQINNEVHFFRFYLTQQSMGRSKKSRSSVFFIKLLHDDGSVMKTYQLEPKGKAKLIESKIHPNFMDKVKSLAKEDEFNLISSPVIKDPIDALDIDSTLPNWTDFPAFGSKQLFSEIEAEFSCFTPAFVENVDVLSNLFN